MISKRLKEWRENNNITRKEIQEKTGLSQSIIQNYEAGTAIPGGTALKKLNEIFKLDINWLLTGEATEPELSKNEKELIQLINQLEERDQIKVIGIVENIVQIKKIVDQK